VQDNHLLARYLGCLTLLEVPDRELQNFARKELAYLDVLLVERPTLRAALDLIIRSYHGHRPNP
jgi:hypothetical protein